MEDLIPKAKKERTATLESEDTLNHRLFNRALADSIGLHVRNFSEVKDPMFPDRFMPENKFKLNLNDAEKPCFMGQWIYADSIKTMNAFYNWLDCFGSDCQSFKFGQDVIMQREGMLLFVNDTSITYLDSCSKLHLKNWQLYLEKQYGIDQWDVVVWQQPGKKAVWMKYDHLPGKKKKQFLPLK
jgi:hypothetical protein